MTSKQALNYLRKINKSGDKKRYYNIIEKDLDILNLIKIRYKKDLLRAVTIMCNDMDLVDARDVELREYLEQ